MNAGASGDVTQILEQVADGDERARLRLVELVYDELRQIAAALLRGERVEHTLQPTALVHEAWIRLMGGAQPDCRTRREFFASATALMRRVLVDFARRRKAAKRGAGRSGLPISADVLEAGSDPLDQTLGVHDALDALAAEDPRKAEVVELRFFGGLSVEEVAAVLEVAPITVKREWRYARAWLLERLGPSHGSGRHRQA
jgi:RNA polymerase sigma factor (TIGR02999 family)